MTEPNDFQSFLKTAKPAVRSYISKLKKINLKLEEQIGGVNADNIALKNKIMALEKIIKNLGGTTEEITVIERIIVKPES